MKEISPNTMLVPMLMRMATPMLARKSSGATQEVVVSISSSTMMGTAMAAAPSTSVTTRFCMLAVLAASPPMAPFSPMSS